jgi:aspartate/tyrosine/aromatic aminotransferase
MKGKPAKANSVKKAEKKVCSKEARSMYAEASSDDEFAKKYFMFPSDDEDSLENSEWKKYAL